MKGGINAFPPKTLVAYGRRKYPRMAGKIKPRRIEGGAKWDTKWPGINGSFKLNGNHIFGGYPVPDV